MCWRFGKKRGEGRNPRPNSHPFPRACPSPSPEIESLSSLLLERILLGPDPSPPPGLFILTNLLSQSSYLETLRCTGLDLGLLAKGRADDG